MSAPAVEAFRPLEDPEHNAVEVPELSDIVAKRLRGAVSGQPPETYTVEGEKELTPAGKRQLFLEDALIHSAEARLRIEAAELLDRDDDDEFVKEVEADCADEVGWLASHLDEGDVPSLAHAVLVVHKQVEAVEKQIDDCPWWKYKKKREFNEDLVEAEAAQEAVTYFVDEGLANTRRDLAARLRVHSDYVKAHSERSRSDDGHEDDEDDDSGLDVDDHADPAGPVRLHRRAWRRGRQFEREHRKGILVVGALAVAGTVAYKAGGIDMVHHVFSQIVQHHGGGHGGAGTASGSGHAAGSGSASTGSGHVNAPGHVNADPSHSNVHSGYVNTGPGHAAAGNNGLEQVTPHTGHLEFASASNADHIVHYLPGKHGESIIRLEDVSPTGSIINGHAIDLSTAHGLYAQITVTGKNGSQQFFDIPLKHVHGHLEAIVPEHLEKIFNIQNHNVAVDIRMNGGHGTTDVFSSAVSNGHRFGAQEIHALDQAVRAGSRHRGGHRRRPIPSPLQRQPLSDLGLAEGVALVAGATWIASGGPGRRIQKRRARRSGNAHGRGAASPGGPVPAGGPGAPPHGGGPRPGGPVPAGGPGAPPHGGGPRPGGPVPAGGPGAPPHGGGPRPGGPVPAGGPGAPPHGGGPRPGGPVPAGGPGAPPHGGGPRPGGPVPAGGPGAPPHGGGPRPGGPVPAGGPGAPPHGGGPRPGGPVPAGGPGAPPHGGGPRPGGPVPAGGPGAPPHGGGPRPGGPVPAGGPGAPPHGGGPRPGGPVPAGGPGAPPHGGGPRPGGPVPAGGPGAPPHGGGPRPGGPVPAGGPGAPPHGGGPRPGGPVPAGGPGAPPHGGGPRPGGPVPAGGPGAPPHGGGPRPGGPVPAGGPGAPPHGGGPRPGGPVPAGGPGAPPHGGGPRPGGPVPAGGPGAPPHGGGPRPGGPVPAGGPGAPPHGGGPRPGGPVPAGGPGAPPHGGGPRPGGPVPAGGPGAPPHGGGPRPGGPVPAGGPGAPPHGGGPRPGGPVPAGGPGAPPHGGGPRPGGPVPAGGPGAPPHGGGPRPGGPVPAGGPGAPPHGGGPRPGGPVPAGGPGAPPHGGGPRPGGPVPAGGPLITSSQPDSYGTVDPNSLVYSAGPATSVFVRVTGDNPVARPGETPPATGPHPVPTSTPVRADDGDEETQPANTRAAGLAGLQPTFIPNPDVLVVPANPTADTRPQPIIRTTAAGLPIRSPGATLGVNRSTGGRSPAVISRNSLPDTEHQSEAAEALNQQRQTMVTQVFEQQSVPDAPDSTGVLPTYEAENFTDEVAVNTRFDSYIGRIEKDDSVGIDAVIDGVRSAAREQVQTGATLLISPSAGGRLIDYLDVVTDIVRARLNPNNRTEDRAWTNAYILAVEQRLVQGRTPQQVYDYLTAAA